MNKTFLILTATAVATGALTVSPRLSAHASVGGDRESNLRTYVEQSNLVLIGAVADVSYRNARIEGGGVLPHTIVTYRIRNVLRGKAPGETFVMRFVGGADGQGHFTSVSGVPMFQPGEQDLLFIASNGKNGCALVECEWGRYRIVRNAVYNTHGAPVLSLIKEHALARGIPPEELRTFSYPAPKFDELMKNPEAQRQLKAQGLSLDQARKRYEAEAPKAIQVQMQFPAMTSEKSDGRGKTDATTASASTGPVTAESTMSRQPISVDAFVAAIKRINSTAKRAPAAIDSIDPKEDIVLKAFQPRVPPRMPVKAASAVSPSAKVSAQEQSELEALAAQDYNPVIKR